MFFFPSVSNGCSIIVQQCKAQTDLLIYATHNRMLQLYIWIKPFTVPMSENQHRFQHIDKQFFHIHLSALTIVTHTDTLGSVPTQWRPLSLINTIVMYPVYCCIPHSRVSDLWPQQPAGLSVFTYALLPYSFILFMFGSNADWLKFQGLKNSWQNNKLSWQCMTSNVHSHV